MADAQSNMLNESSSLVARLQSLFSDTGSASGSIKNTPTPSTFAWPQQSDSFTTLPLNTCFDVLVGSEQVRVGIDDRNG